jgi:UDPglucose 6-dehydrogenase
VRGFRVWGVDIDEEKIGILRQGRAPFYEPDLDMYVEQAIRSGRFIPQNSYHEAIRNSQITLFLVNTPSLEDGRYSNRYLEQAAESCGKLLSSINRYHLFVVVSTVMPGTIETNVKDLLERRSGKKVVRDFGLCYNPEFIAIGSVIKDLLNPDFVLIGESDARAGRMLAQLYSKFLEKKAPIERTSIINAEIAKISLNAYVTNKISFANFLSEVCEKVPAANATEILRIIGGDRRIGRAFLNPGLGYGGPCFPRDNRAFSVFAEQFDEDAVLAKSTDSINNRHLEHLIKDIKKIEPDRCKIAVLGLTYRVDTYVTEESQALQLARSLSADGYEVAAFDPGVFLAPGRRFPGIPTPEFQLCETVQECLAGASMCIIATPWKQFKELSPDEIVYLMKDPKVFDCWGILEHCSTDSRMRYFRTGKYISFLRKPLSPPQAGARHSRVRRMGPRGFV